MNKLVVFDLDGTLLHTLPDIADRVNKTMRKFGFPEHQEKTIMGFIGNGAKVLIERSLGANLPVQNFNEILDYFKGIYTDTESEKTTLFEGIDALLIKLKEEGYKLAVFTNKPMPTTEKVYDKYLKEYNFDMVLGATDRFKHKPDKEGLCYIMDTLNVSAKNTIMVGDGDTDIMVAKNANVLGVAVLWGYRNKEQLEEAGAKYFANTAEELYDIITSKR